MNPLHEAIQQNVVAPMLKERAHTMPGEITEYDNSTNRATVKIQNPLGVGMRLLEDVPVQIGSGGVHSAGPFVGDMVWINFIGGNLSQPKIVALCDEIYQYETRERMKHKRKGSLIPDSYGR